MDTLGGQLIINDDRFFLNSKLKIPQDRKGVEGHSGHATQNNRFLSAKTPRAVKVLSLKPGVDQNTGIKRGSFVFARNSASLILSFSVHSTQFLQIFFK